MNVKKYMARLIRGNRQALAGCMILGIWILFAVLVPAFWPWSYSEQNAEIQNQAMSMTHLFGTDKFGRDIFARVWYGAGISLLIGIVSALINGCVGVLYGYGSREELTAAGACFLAEQPADIADYVLGK